MSQPSVVRGADGIPRCAWGASTADYVAYHDAEWGVPLHGERELFERLTLEAFQSGLSWLTILRKREGFRAAFAGFDPERVAGFGPEDRARLMADPGIVRNGRKIDAAIHNAAAVVDLRADGGLDALVWSPAHRTPSAPDHGRAAAHVARVGGPDQDAQDARVRLPRPDHPVCRDAGLRLG